MAGLLPNALTRPDFISFHWEHRMLPAVWLCKKLHRLPVFCWTVTDPEEMSRLEREGFLVIFEGFQPEASPPKLEEDDKGLPHPTCGCGFARV